MVLQGGDTDVSLSVFLTNAVSSAITSWFTISCRSTIAQCTCMLSPSTNPAVFPESTRSTGQYTTPRVLRRTGRV